MFMFENAHKNTIFFWSINKYGKAIKIWNNDDWSDNY